ncbi:hypothetical protein [Aquimarina rhabdastrellae]
MTGEFLKEKIKSTGFQQVEVASRLGITPQSLESKLKSKDIKVSFLLEVARALNKNIYFFLDELQQQYYIKDYNNSSDNSMTSDPVIPDTPVSEMVSEELVKKLDLAENHIQVVTQAQTRTLLNQDEILEKLDQILLATQKK